MVLFNTLRETRLVLYWKAILRWAGRVTWRLGDKRIMLHSYREELIKSLRDGSRGKMVSKYTCKVPKINIKPLGALPSWS